MSRPSPLAPLLFLAHTVLIQMTAAATAIITWDLTHSLALCAIASVVVSVSGSSFLQLSPSWRIMNGFIPLATLATLTLEIPSWLFLAPLLTLGCIYAPAFWTRVPYYPTSRETYPMILAELPIDRPFTFIDIGCGLGDLLIFLQRHRPQGSFYGTEIGILPFLISRTKAILRAPDRVTIYFRDLRSLDLSTFEYVYAFLSPAAMDSVWEKVRRELPPGATFITNSFKVQSTESYAVPVKDQRGTTLFVHKMEPTNAKKRLGALRS